MINQPFPQCPSEEWITFIKETNPKILIHRIYLGEVHFKILITLGKREALKPKEPHVKSLTELSKYKNLPGGPGTAFCTLLSVHGFQSPQARIFPYKRMAHKAW